MRGMAATPHKSAPGRISTRVGDEEVYPFLMVTGRQTHRGLVEMLERYVLSVEAEYPPVAAPTLETCESAALGSLEAISAHGCSMEPLSNWDLPLVVFVYSTRKSPGKGELLP